MSKSNKIQCLTLKYKPINRVLSHTNLKVSTVSMEAVEMPMHIL